MRSAARFGMAMRTIVTAGVVCTAFAGCAKPHRDPSPGDYVFFSRDPDLKPISSPPGVFVSTNSRKPIRGQHRFIVNPGQVSFQPNAPYWLNAAKSQELADFLRAEVIASLSQRYQIVETPAPGVLRVSPMLLDIRKRDNAGSSGPQFQPMLILYIMDPMTGESVALVRDMNRGNEFAAAIQSDEAEARKLISEWAGLLRARLEQIEQAASQPAR